MYGVISFMPIETTPGVGSAFAPPDGFNGDDAAYLALMRKRFREDPGCKQHMVIAARLLRKGQVVFAGPYAKPAMDIARALAKD